MRICQPCMEGGCASVDVQYWKRMMSKVFNSSNNTNVVVEVPLQFSFFSLWTFVSKTLKYFSLERTVQIWVLRLLFLESVFSSQSIQYEICFWVHNIGRKKGKKCNPQKFRNFELLSFETQKNIKGLMRSVGYLFRTVVLLFVQILSLSTSKKDHTEINI